MKTIKNDVIDNDQREAIVQKARKVISSLERNLAIYENDLQRNAKTLCDNFGITNVTKALEKVKGLNSKLPEVQLERDNLIVEIQEYLNKNNL